MLVTSKVKSKTSKSSKHEKALIGLLQGTVVRIEQEEGALQV